MTEQPSSRDSLSRAPDGADPHADAPRRAPRSAWQLLHVECDDVEAMRVKMELRRELADGSQIDHATHLQEALAALAHREYDVVLVGGLEPSLKPIDGLRRLTSEPSHPPVVMLTDDDDPKTALVAGRCGVHTVLRKSRLTADALLATLTEAIEGETAHDKGNSADRRREPRYDVALPAVVFPVRPDGGPGAEFIATTIDVSAGGLAILAERDSDLVPDVCLVGVECRDGVYRYATVEWRYRRLALPAIRFGGRFLRRWDDPFHPSRLLPRYDAQSLRYRPAMDASVLEAWAARGILRSEVIDRTLVCPLCESLPTFRRGCPQCGAAGARAAQMIHHFACAPIAPAAAFHSATLACPKCKVDRLVAGTDFEYLDGACACHECGWTGSEATLIAECVKCGNRCLSSAALEKEMVAFHVVRLDPLALIENAR